GRLGRTTAGPQSLILGERSEELIKLRADFEDSNGRSAKTLIIGTASKGIIDRQHHHTAQVYRQLYPSNPFTSETDEDIRKYMQEVRSIFIGYCIKIDSSWT
ncbi:hypothetical protein GCK32_020557, partial [Trichostrongylus colubriformis]